MIYLIFETTPFSTAQIIGAVAFSPVVRLSRLTGQLSELFYDIRLRLRNRRICGEGQEVRRPKCRNSLTHGLVKFE
ncbi:Unannotated [Lentimonas sp. CC19]|nr:Unannotated [Lentimonas sp. CC10]CAA6691986.1 Unannotated [Lentimonas sp. CC19]CAA7070542.1 Unannotated [Lentimonas sp. CC11]